MTNELIKKIKEVKQALVNIPMEGDDFEERSRILAELEDVTNYLKDEMGKGIEI